MSLMQKADWDDSVGVNPSLSKEEIEAQVNQICDVFEAGQHLLVADEDGILHPVFVPAQQVSNGK